VRFVNGDVVVCREVPKALLVWSLVVDAYQNPCVRHSRKVIRSDAGEHIDVFNGEVDYEAFETRGNLCGFARSELTPFQNQ